MNDREYVNLVLLFSKEIIRSYNDDCLRVKTTQGLDYFQTNLIRSYDCLRAKRIDIVSTLFKQRSHNFSYDNDCLERIGMRRHDFDCS